MQESEQSYLFDNSFLSSSVTFHQICNKDDRAGATSGAETPTLPEHLVVFVIFNILDIILSVLRITASDYPFGILNHF